MISVDSVSKSFGKKLVLQDIALDVNEGDKLCVVGKSGSGKSVLLKVILGLLEPDAGKVEMDGEPVNPKDHDNWNRLMESCGMIFQGAALFDSLTVYENVGIRMIESAKMKRDEIEGRVVASLRAVGLDGDIIHKFPAELSGGMRKRVGIARAIINDPKYLFYDEPTTGLDPVNSDIIDQLIDRLSHEPGRTSVVVTHDMYTVRTIATSVAMIHETRLHYHGSPEAFFQSADPVIREFLKRNF